MAVGAGGRERPAGRGQQDRPARRRHADGAPFRPGPAGPRLHGGPAAPAGAGGPVRGGLVPPARALVPPAAPAAPGRGGGGAGLPGHGPHRGPGAEIPDRRPGAGFAGLQHLARPARARRAHRGGRRVAGRRAGPAGRHRHHAGQRGQPHHAGLPADHAAAQEPVPGHQRLVFPVHQPLQGAVQRRPGLDQPGFAAAGPGPGPGPGGRSVPGGVSGPKNAAESLSDRGPGRSPPRPPSCCCSENSRGSYPHNPRQ